MENPLVPSVQCLPPAARVAMFNAASSDTLKRRTWRGCPLNRAGCQLGADIVNERSAMNLFHTSRRSVRKFLISWDYLAGSDEQCTTLLRNALLSVGLFTDTPAHQRWRRRARAVPTFDPVIEPAWAAPIAEAFEAEPDANVETTERIPVGAGV